MAYLRYDAPARWSILEVMPVGGGQPRELFRDKNNSGGRFSGLAWSPDKRYVLVVKRTDGTASDASELWKVPVAGGPAEPTGLTWPGELRFPTIDPKGSRLLFAGAGGAEAAMWAIEMCASAFRASRTCSSESRH